jgi:hypothetical protein
MNDRIQEFSQNLAPQSEAVQFHAERGMGIHVPWWAYLLAFLVFVAFIAVKSDVIVKKDDKKSAEAKK